MGPKIEVAGILRGAPLSPSMALHVFPVVFAGYPLDTHREVQEGSTSVDLPTEALQRPDSSDTLDLSVSLARHSGAIPR